MILLRINWPNFVQFSIQLGVLGNGLSWYVVKCRLYSVINTIVQGRLKTGHLIVWFSIIFLTGQTAKKPDCPVKNQTPGNPRWAINVLCGHKSLTNATSVPEHRNVWDTFRTGVIFWALFSQCRCSINCVLRTIFKVPFIKFCKSTCTYMYSWCDGLQQAEPLLSIFGHPPVFIRIVLEGVDRSCIDDTLRKFIPSVNDCLTEEVFPEIKMAPAEG